MHDRLLNQRSLFWHLSVDAKIQHCTLMLIASLTSLVVCPFASIRPNIIIQNNMMER